MTATSADDCRCGRVVGRVAPGAKLPSARDLQAQYGIANSTAQNALRVLEEEGLIYSVQGRGVFVRQLSPRDQFLKRYNEMLDESITKRRADEEAARLSGKSDDEVAAELAAAEERFTKASTEEVLAGPGRAPVRGARRVTPPAPAPCAAPPRSRSRSRGAPAAPCR
ncbi:GntR family transcriptional regulator [Streptomyces sp. NPDC057062]|uniref:GntR family transcriptional regulator n=1 Tax=unclassified Streptomyces TaxID=2593676 RepID=UPI0020766EDA|nr:winged helix-turn-helix domain-containing protein [Streptomyces sp. MBT84]